MALSTGLAQANTMFNRLNRLTRDVGPLIIEDGPLAVTANTTDGPPLVTTTVTSPSQTKYGKLPQPLGTGKLHPGPEIV